MRDTQQPRERSRRTAVALAGVYVIAGIVWVFGSTRLLTESFADATTMGPHQGLVVTGIFYFLLTGAFIGFLLERLLRASNRRGGALSADLRYRRIADSNMIGILFWHSDGRITEANDYLLDMLGYTREELSAGEICWDKITPPGYLELDRRALEEIRSRGTCTPFEKVYVRKDGTTVPILIGGSALDEKGVHGISFVLDISAQKETERRLRQKEREFRTALDNLPNVFIIYNRERRIHFANARLLSEMGLSAGDVIGKRDKDLLAPEEEQKYTPILEKAYETGEVQQDVFSLMTPGGRRFSDLWFVPLKDTSGETAQVMMISRDITHERQAERALQEQKRELHQIIDHVPHFIFAKDLHGKFILANKAVAEVYGTTVESLIGRTDADLNGSESEVERFRQDDLQVIQEGRPLVIPREVVTDASGRERLLETIKIPLKRNGSDLPAVLGVSTDITERNRAEEALRQSEKRFRTLVDNAVDAFYLHDRQGRIVDLNRRACESLGYTREELLGMNIHDIESNFEAGKLDLVWQKMRLGHPVTFDGIHIRKDGTTFPVEVLINLLEGQEEVLFLAVARDVTERSRAELEGSALAQLGVALAASDTLEDIAVALFDASNLLWKWDSGFFSVKRSGEACYLQVLGIDTVDGKLQRFAGSQYEVPKNSFLSAVHRGDARLLNRQEETGQDSLPPFGDTGRRSASLMFVPVRVAHEPVGLISLQSYTPDQFQQEDLDILARVANMVAPAVDRMRAEARAAAYVALGEKLAGVETPQEAAQVILELADRLIGWHAASVSLYSEEDDTVHSLLQVDVINGQRTEVKAVRHQAAPIGNMRRALDEGPLLILRSPEESLSDSVMFGDKARRSASILWTPIRSGTKITGLLSIQSYSYHAYSGKDLDDLQALANHCGGALERTRAQNALRESEAKYRRAIQGAGAVPYQLEFSTMNYVFVGEEIERITGYSSDEFTGELWRSMVLEVRNLAHGDSTASDEGAVRVPQNEWHADIRFRTRSGEEKWVSDYSVQVVDEVGKVKGSLGILVDITERKRSEEALRRSEELYRRAITEADAVPYQLDYRTSTFTFIGEGIERISGYSAEGFTTENWQEIVQEIIMRGEAAGMTPLEAVQAARSGKIQQWQADLRIQTRTGETRWLADSAVQIRDENGKSTGSLGILHDITDRKATEDALRDSEQRYALAAQGANDGLWDWDLRTDTIFYSARWKEMLGYADAELSDRQDEWFSRVHPEDTDRLRLELDAHLSGASDHLESEHRMLHRDGHWLWMLCRGLAVRDNEGTATRIAGSLTDITGTREAQERLLHDALHDGLTALPNRSLLLDRLGRSLERARRKTDYQFAVLFLDLDRFKNVNDSLGHLLGDQVLITISSRLITCLRPGDTVARFAGDEFAMLLDDILELKDVRTVAERVLHCINQPILLEGHEIRMTSSIGVALSNSNYVSPDEVIRDADTALYRAKARGKSRYEIFNPAMHQHVVEALSLENDFRRALDREELTLFYQPIVNLANGTIAGLEALLRWPRESGFVSPEKFIPLAEETGLIVPLGNWVLQKVAQQMLQWAHYDELYVSINISPRQFVEPDLDSTILAIFRAAGIEPGRVALEITETALMASPDEAARVLQQLHNAGFRLYLDDFGTGYSSLSYLHRFPIDVVKIDRSFVQRMKNTGREREIVQSIMMLTSGLKLAVTAEGVETSEQLEIIRALGCDSAQGYLFAQPMPPENVTELLSSFPSW